MLQLKDCGYSVYFQKLPAKECDDEDECGSANDLFSNDGSGDVITKEFYQSDNKVILKQKKRVQV